MVKHGVVNCICEAMIFSALCTPLIRGLSVITVQPTTAKLTTMTPSTTFPTTPSATTPPGTTPMTPLTTMNNGNICDNYCCNNI